MTKLKVFSSALLLAIVLFGTEMLYSQQRFGVGTFTGILDGDTVSFGLNSDLNNLYFMADGGTADFGLIKIQWNDVTPAQVKVGTLEMEKGFVESQDKKISVIWADFLTIMPNIIKSGRLSVTGNTGSAITGTLELTVELGGSPMLGEFLKGKKESKLTQGYFEINY
jgi:hypothetical protein